MDKKILLISQDDHFSKQIGLCLKEDMLNINVSNKFDDNAEIVIVNMYNYSTRIEKQLDIVLQSEDVIKVILLENALELYLNSKNKLPFSVYEKISPKNETCKQYLDLEHKVCESKKSYVIFRISEIYGESFPYGLVSKLLSYRSNEYDNSLHDFIYDGDVVSAIEIALKKEVTGLFDIASGKSIDLKDLVELIKQLKQININKIKWKRKQQDIVFNCENFKFYKWEPLVDMQMGLKTLLTLRRKNHGWV